MNQGYVNAEQNCLNVKDIVRNAGRKKGSKQKGETGIKGSIKTRQLTDFPLFFCFCKALLYKHLNKIKNNQKIAKTGGCVS